MPRSKRPRPCRPSLRVGTSQNDIRAGMGVGSPGDPMFTLQAGKQHAVSVDPSIIAFGANDSGQDARTDDTSPTLRAGNADKSNANAGTPPAIAMEAKVYDMRGRGDGETVPTLLTDHPSRPSDYCPMIFEPRVARNGRGAPEEISPPLKAQSGEDGRGDSAPVVFKPCHYTRGKDGAPSEVAPPVTAEQDRGDTHPVVFSLMPQNSGKDYKARETEVSQPILGAGPQPASAQGGDIVVTPAPLILDEYNQTSDEQCYPLRTATGDGIPKLVQDLGEPTAFDLNQVTCPHNRSNPKPGDPCHTMPATTTPPMIHQPLEPFAVGGGVPRAQGEIMATLDAARESRGANQQRFLANAHIVRRLTPLECERLQGFPDNYTLIEWDAARRDIDDHAETVEYLLAHGFNYTEAEEFAITPDGPRYKACGNSMAVDVIEWIGRRIQMVEDILAELAAKEVKPKKKRA